LHCSPDILGEIATRKINWAKSASRTDVGVKQISFLNSEQENNIKMYFEMEYEGLEPINLAQGTSGMYMIKCIA